MARSFSSRCLSILADTLTQAKRFLEYRQPLDGPAVHGRMIHRDAALSHYLLKITQAQRIGHGREVPIKIRQSKYLNNVVEQDHRPIKLRTRPMLGFKTFRCARILLAGFELMHTIAKGRCSVLAGPSRRPPLDSTISQDKHYYCISTSLAFDSQRDKTATARPERRLYWRSWLRQSRGPPMMARLTPSARRPER
ncbi:hypothetical protein QFZ91_006131 [Paraburkholderia sp. JPY419]